MNCKHHSSVQFRAFVLQCRGPVSMEDSSLMFPELGSLKSRRRCLAGVSSASLPPLD